VDYEHVITRAAGLGTDPDTDENDAEARWQLIRELHRSTGRDAFEAVAAAAGSDDRARRLVGLDALGQIGYAANRPYVEETLPVLLSVLAAADATNAADAADTGDAADAPGAGDAEVIASAVTALGHVADPRGLPAVLRHVGHPNDAVRFAVAVALPTLTDPDEPAADAVRALITLTCDADPQVRDWATFGLGTQLAADGPEIRDALAARLDDSCDHAGEEAVMGLARRGDPRATAPLLDQLRLLADDGSVLPGTLLFEAVAVSQPQEALPLLRRLWQRRDDFEPSARRMLGEALASLGEPSRLASPISAAQDIGTSVND
jgi:HEAT repeat protein